ncbi:hypothetical protein JQ557_33295 [Bradyrhizobium sp. U87765 SZCCT0131]|uniref:hypothetical protein n=1 Tax=unclassified Bradyrhizobium TaxID=2631580 RepID=UPI001BAA2886|nr:MULTISPECIES: hypothetical protein [unclassified Bradyrhizobium]MBR1222918.1 hypothetical protein [Bradyrhizobium sp. U87765 SZCCT0131]MBR1262654.1 hypothetical protein [Bradyrhizobium sp. U87765 SZCCT0134]MBR1308874.1 hypothetical protein [Bradyrhizobium sp. U87765 SZCCT0110]MBR1318436.1 hypothetical protein [Bradyrhizobium sp. U87765 SZCCT0109]MBR1352140.1 hypothetical protein [Bradyrhizobium sp. U87765 SZCCT0048]
MTNAGGDGIGPAFGVRRGICGKRPVLEAQALATARRLLEDRAILHLIFFGRGHMRWGIIIAAVALSGCSNTTELGNSFSLTVTAFNSGIASQEQLEVDLLKDVIRKSEQLEYISKGSYSCGDPRDPQIIALERRARASALKVRDNAVQALREKNAYINAVLGYGETIAAFVKQQADRDELLQKWATTIGTFSGLVATPEAKAFSASANLIIADLRVIGQYATHEQIRSFAARIASHLRANVAHLRTKRSLRALTENEERAYQLWNACARERLDFIRQFFPPTYGAERNRPYPAVAPSPAWDFMTAYGAYISERETFLGRKPDFAALLQAIVDANDAIVEDKVDLLTAANAMGEAATTIKSSADGIRKAAESVGG